MKNAARRHRVMLTPVRAPPRGQGGNAFLIEMTIDHGRASQKVGVRVEIGNHCSNVSG
jgi:hypothetical protein